VYLGQGDQIGRNFRRMGKSLLRHFLIVTKVLKGLWNNFSTENFMHFSLQKCVGPHFWAIFSQTHLVTLTLVCTFLMGTCIKSRLEENAFLHCPTNSFKF
jgi:hypothetical protein